MKGFVPTPDSVVDSMIERLFSGGKIQRSTRVLDPGCGTGIFIEGIMRWCQMNRVSLPRIDGVELDPHRFEEAKEKFRSHTEITIFNEDFLKYSGGPYDYVVGNPPYVSIGHLDQQEKETYRKLFSTATGRFDLYVLFFEQSIKLLKDSGRLVFITPEKFTYVESAASLRELLSSFEIEELNHVNEDTFSGFTTYPVISSLRKSEAKGAPTIIRFRDGTLIESKLPVDGRSWLSSFAKLKTDAADFVSLGDLCQRISCGVATGADGVFVVSRDDLPKNLRRFAFPTISGRQLGSSLDLENASHLMVVPYSKNGELLDLGEAPALDAFLNEPDKKKQLLARTCVRRKPWFSFHENPPLHEILRPKLLCKDIAGSPKFWIDRTGSIVPRHSVYYVVPKSANDLEPLAEFLNSDFANQWLKANCQRAANGFIRLQSSVLKHLPVPGSVAFKLQSYISHMASHPIPKETSSPTLVSNRN